MIQTATDTTLQGLCLLSVRPFSSEQGSGSFSQLLKERGAQVLHYPVMTLDYPQSGIEFERVKTIIMTLADYDKAVVVSVTAAKLVLDWIDRYWPQLPVKPDFFAVGESSANVLRAHSVSVNYPSQLMTSEGLLSLPQFQQVKNQKIVIFRGVGGRETLANSLRDKGAEIIYANLYTRLFCSDYKIRINEAIANGVPLLVAHSGELLKGMVKNCDPDNLDALYNTPLLVPSRRLEAFARTKGFGDVLVAVNASPVEMVSAIEHWYITRKKID